MVSQTKLAIEEFDRFALLPENADKILEYIGGEVVEVPSNPYASKISGIISGELYIFLKGRNLGHLTGEAGGYRVSGERYAPDVAFIAYDRQPELVIEGYNPNPPDLAVEVDFPSTYQSQKELRTKVVNYLAAGTMVWVVLPETKQVEVYVPGQPMKLLGLDGTLDGGNVLPGFTLAVKDIFAE
ncbi:MAG: Uma2 family endonuclease [Chloroflexi bacterium]|nr:Uma2 family endonuclease [Chloroflexota bacterium]MDL1883282.1 Uma2 family endonuclease [Anaerolineae bacterium CFX8]